MKKIIALCFMVAALAPAVSNAQAQDALLSSKPSNVNKLPPLLVDPSLIKPNSPEPPMNNIATKTDYRLPNSNQNTPYIDKSSYGASSNTKRESDSITGSTQTITKDTNLSVGLDKSPNSSGTLNILNIKGSN